MQVWTEVKCYNCSRVCGGLEGTRPPVWVLFHADRLLPGVGCSLNSRTGLRCSHCGGRVYPGETYSGNRPAP